MSEGITDRDEYRQGSADESAPSIDKWDMTPPEETLPEAAGPSQRERRTEVIAGVTVVYTGESVTDLDGVEEQQVEMYDANGNEFYSNYSNRELAEKAKEELAAKGKTAVIGPEAPWRSTDGGVMAPRGENRTAVGLYIVPETTEVSAQDSAAASAEDADATVNPEDFDF